MTTRYKEINICHEDKEFFEKSIKAICSYY